MCFMKYRTLIKLFSFNIIYKRHIHKRTQYQHAQDFDYNKAKIKEYNSLYVKNTLGNQQHMRQLLRTVIISFL